MKKLIPKQIDIEVTSACNLKCRYCPGLNTKATHMDVDLFKSIIRRVDFPTTIVPWLNGEPFLHPQYDELLKEIELKKLRYYITTNGMLWRDDIFDIIMRKDSSCYQIIFSFDGLPESRSPELARPGTDQTLVLKNIYKAMGIKKQLDSPIDIAVKICKRGQDYQEIEEYISFWLEEGADFVVVGDSLIEENNPVGFRRYPCQYSDNNFMVIKSDGRLVRCAYNSRATNDPKYDFGIVGMDTPLLDIYNKPICHHFRVCQGVGVYYPPCDTCGFAYTGMGLRGLVSFRNPLLTEKTIHYQQDYYNQFFSLTRKWKNKEYYTQGFSGEVML